MPDNPRRRSIDLNADVGEDPSPEGLARDLRLLEVVTSANIACGGHAGDEQTMATLVRHAAALGVGIGAHPGYPDRAGFGRAAMTMPPEALEAEVRAQVSRLAEVAHGLGKLVGHVKPHGALYHACSASEEVAEAVARGCQSLPGKVVLVGLAGSAALATWQGLGFAAAPEAFADRAYDDRTTLRDRRLPGAVLTPEASARQALAIARGDGVMCGDTAASIEAVTLCLHGDAPQAVERARLVRQALDDAGIDVRRLIDQSPVS